MQYKQTIKGWSVTQLVDSQTSKRCAPGTYLLSTSLKCLLTIGTCCILIGLLMCKLNKIE